MNCFFLSRWKKFFIDTTSTVGLEWVDKEIIINRKKVKVILKDTSGQERLFCITKQYLREGDGAVIVYDVTNRESFENVYKWYKLIKDVRSSFIVFTIIANKIDLINERVISYSEGLKVAEELNAFYIETSCKDYENVEEAMMITFKHIYSEKYKNSYQESENITWEAVKKDKVVKREEVVKVYKIIEVEKPVTKKDDWNW